MPTATITSKGQITLLLAGEYAGLRVFLRVAVKQSRTHQQNCALDGMNAGPCVVDDDLPAFDTATQLLHEMLTGRH